MTENSELISTDHITAQDLAAVINEFEEYRERLINETMTTAQRAKLPKAKAMAQLEPELAKIDTSIQQLRDSLRDAEQL